MPALRAWLVLSAVACGAACAACGGTPASGGTTTPGPSAPAITQLSPSSLIAGKGGFDLNISGSNFSPTSVVLWNGEPRPTQIAHNFDPGSDPFTTALVAQITAADIATMGKFTVQVVDGGLKSNTMAFWTSAPAQAGAGPVGLISIGYDGKPGNGSAFEAAAISSTGRYVAFQSTSTNIVPGPASGYADIYLRDTCIGAPAGCVPNSIRASVAYNGALPNGHSRNPWLSDDGRYVVFDSSASNLVPNDTQAPTWVDVFLRDTCVNAPAGCVPSTTRVSLQPNGAETGSDAGYPQITPDGRFIVFDSGAKDLVVNQAATPGPGSFMWDTCHGAMGPCQPRMNMLTLSSAGLPGNAGGGRINISGNDRYAVFESYSTDLVPGGTNDFPNIYVRDTCFRAPLGCSPSTLLATLGNDGSQQNGFLDGAMDPSISADGRYVPFSTQATNMVSANSNDPHYELFLRDTCLGAPAGCVPSTRQLSHAYDGSMPNGASFVPTISPSGRLVAFSALAANLVPEDPQQPNTNVDVFVYDTCLGQPSSCVPSTVRISVSPNDGIVFGDSSLAEISADDHWITFLSGAPGLLGVNSIMPPGTTQVYLARTGY